MLEKRKQLDDEQTVAYINETESLYRRVDPLMSQSEIVRNIMKGLKPNIAKYIGMMENLNIKELRANIKKYENIEFLITGQTFQSPSEIKESNFKEQINQLATQLNEKIKNLSDNNEKLKQEIEKSKIQPKNNYKSNNYKGNKYKGNINDNLPLYIPPPQQSNNNTRNNDNTNSNSQQNFNYNKPKCENCSKFGRLKRFVAVVIIFLIHVNYVTK